jgi:hypothetical protein
MIPAGAPQQAQQPPPQMHAQQPHYQQPAQQPHYQQHAQPQYAHAQAPPRARGAADKKKIIMIAAAGVVVAGGAIAAILLLTGGGDDGPRGATSTESLAKSALAAMESGDGGGYMRLTMNGAMAPMLDCKIPGDADDREMRPMYEKMLTYGMKYSKGKKLALKTIEPAEDKPFTVDKGKRVMGSCRLKEDLTLQSFVLKLADGSEKDELKMSAMKAGDRWYLSSIEGLEPTDDPDRDKWMKDIETMTKEAEAKRKQRYRSEAGGSPEAVVRGLLDAALAQSSDRAKAIHLSFDEMEELSCSEDTRDKIKDSLSVLDHIEREDEDEGEGEGDDKDKKDKPKEPKLKIVGVKSMDKGKADAGADLRGCKGKTAAEWEQLQVEIKEANDDDTDKLDVLMVKLDGSWRVFYIDG